MALKEMPAMGDKIRYIGGKNFGIEYGDIYEISGMSFGDATFRDAKDNRRSIVIDRFPYWEIVTEPEPSPSVTDILANLALRVSELERHNREQAYEINELYKAVSAND